jgi:hypothetical protein
MDERDLDVPVTLGGWFGGVRLASIRGSIALCGVVVN